jgi:hypothetical protein
MQMVNRARHLLLFALSALAGCVQPAMQASGSGFGNRTSVVSFPACEAKVEFSGNPEVVSDAEKQQLEKSLGTYGKTNVSAWRFGQYRLEEVASCICRDYPMTHGEFHASWIAQGFTEIPLLRTKIDGVGAAMEYERTYSVEDSRRFRTVLLESNDKCAMLLGVKAPQTKAPSIRFYSSLLPTAMATTASPPNRNIESRLRQLEQLLKDRQITQDEYNQQRKKILDSL